LKNRSPRHGAPDRKIQKDDVENAPVVNTGNAARFVRERRPDYIPFAVAEFISHDSKLSFWSLNHDSNIRLCLDVRLRGQSGRRMVLRRESANDPKRTLMIGSHFALRSSSSTGAEVDPVWYELIIGMIVYFCWFH
jgi:hypothetical protein